MARRRKVGNLLAVPVLSALGQQPMYPYQIAAMLRGRGKDQSVAVNWGSFYTVIKNLEKNGFIEAIGTTREGNQPERTTYRLTEAGREELLDWLRELIGEPEREATRLEAGLSDGMNLHPDELMALLRHRLEILDAAIAGQRAELDQLGTLPRVFVIESELHLALLVAQADWIRGLLAEMESGTLAGFDELRRFHETGEVAPALAELLEQEVRKYQ